MFTCLRKPLTVASLVAAAVAVVPAVPADAAPPGVTATYHDRSINLRNGWSTARSCVVTAAATRCYASNAEADAAIGATIGATAPQQRAAVPACASGWLCLYEHNDGGGRRLIFQSEGWQSLVPYGFDRQTSSWRNAY